MKIDFVLLWNDNLDSEWQENYRKYSVPHEGNIPARFRDWGWLRYWFRGVEKYAPWVNKIFIVSACNPPTWLNTENEKIVWVKHEDFIPKEFLPTFNSRTIEFHLHHIKGLSEHFVNFNDDMFLNAPVSPEYYFKNNLPCDITLECLFLGSRYSKGQWENSITEFCNIGVLNAHFNRREVIKGNLKRWYGSYLPLSSWVKAFLLYKQCRFFNFCTPHFETPLLKSIFSEIWNAEPDMLRNSCSRFRQNLSVNIYLMRFWQLASNRFTPDNKRSKGFYSEITSKTIDKICDEIVSGNKISVCFNDSIRCSDEMYIQARPQILKAFMKKHPNPCIFEK